MWVSEGKRSMRLERSASRLDLLGSERDSRLEITIERDWLSTCLMEWAQDWRESVEVRLSLVRLRKWVGWVSGKFFRSKMMDLKGAPESPMRRRLFLNSRL
jgi:hypothetical protein